MLISIVASRQPWTTGFIVDPDQRKTYLQSLRQAKQQTFEQLYGFGRKGKSTTIPNYILPRTKAFMKDLSGQQKGFQDTGDAVHRSALQEVEQEREVTYEIEVAKVLQKPVRHQPLLFPGVHKDIISFVKTGRLVVDPNGYESAINALRRTKLVHKHAVTANGTSGKLFISTEFTRTIQPPFGRPYNNFQVCCRSHLHHPN